MKKKKDLETSDYYCSFIATSYIVCRVRIAGSWKININSIQFDFSETTGG
jgi:hypothetical protein